MPPPLRPYVGAAAREREGNGPAGAAAGVAAAPATAATEAAAGRSMSDAANVSLEKKLSAAEAWPPIPSGQLQCISNQMSESETGAMEPSSKGSHRLLLLLLLLLLLFRPLLSEREGAAIG